jgi:medium-chain acyl-[acyl-carrier-protein] hydrolase
VPDRVAAQPDFRQIFEPGLRADYALLSGYEFVPADPPATKITVVHGRADPILGSEDVAGWRAHAAETFGSIAISGGHWLLDGDLAELAAALRAGNVP